MPTGTCVFVRRSPARSRAGDAAEFGVAMPCHEGVMSHDRNGAEEAVPLHKFRRSFQDGI